MNTPAVVLPTFDSSAKCKTLFWRKCTRIRTDKSPSRSAVKFGALPYGVQQHMLQHVRQLHQANQMQTQPPQYACAPHRTPLQVLYQHASAQAPQQQPYPVPVPVQQVPQQQFGRQMSGAPTNGPKRLDIAVPSNDHMIRAYRSLAGISLPLTLSNGQQATVTAVNATPLILGQPAQMDLQVVRSDGRFRRLSVSLVSQAPNAGQVAMAAAGAATPINRSVHFAPYAQTVTPRGRGADIGWEPISG